MRERRHGARPIVGAATPAAGGCQTLGARVPSAVCNTATERANAAIPQPLERSTPENAPLALGLQTPDLAMTNPDAVGVSRARREMKCMDFMGPGPIPGRDMMQRVRAQVNTCLGALGHVCQPQQFLPQSVDCEAKTDSPTSAQTAATMAIVEQEVVEQDGVRFRGWEQRGYLRYFTEEDAMADGFLTIARLRKAYPTLCSGAMTGCRQKTSIQCQLDAGTEWNPMTTALQTNVGAMLNSAGVVKKFLEWKVREALDAPWPRMLGIVADIKESLKREDYKTITYWGHTYIAEAGFHIDLSGACAFPRMYKIVINHHTVSWGRIHWDATNTAYSKLLTENEWLRWTGVNFNKEKGDLVEIICFFGAVAPYYPKHFRFAGFGWQDTYRMLSEDMVHIAVANECVSISQQGCQSLLDQDDDEDEPLPVRVHSIQDNPGREAVGHTDQQA